MLVSVPSMIKSIPKIRQSSLLWLFPTISRNVIWGHILLIALVVSDCSSLVLFNLLVKVLARVADRTCTTQVTLKKVRNALLIHKGLVFTRVHGILSFFLFLVFNFFTIFNMIISNFIFKMTLRRLRNVVTFRVDFYYKRWICWTICKIYLVWWYA